MMEAKPIEGTNLVLFGNFGAKYQIGDIVQLKSGGPSSTVTGCDRMHVEVQWYVKGTLHGATHPIEAVQLIGEDNGASV